MADIAELIARRRRSDRVFVGIGGGSASGKSTIAARIAEQLAPLAVEVICQDRFFKPTDQLPTYPSMLRDRPWPDHNHPDSFDRERMFAHCRSAGDGAVDGCDVVIFEGILALHYAELRELMDVKCYVVADADERIVRRVKRNLPRSKVEDITDFYLESVRHQHERYNAPTQRHADLVIPGGMADQAEREALLAALCTAIRGAFGDRR